MIESTFSQHFGTLYLPNWWQYDVEKTEQHLLELPWMTKRTARHEYFMSDKKLTYSYGKVDNQDVVYNAEPFTDLVGFMMDRLNTDLDAEFNACFLNKYDNEQQHLGWHSDDFAGMRHDQPIAVVSFGAERRIWVKEKGVAGNIPDEQKILLQKGSLFIMPEGYQDTHVHKIPKHDRPCGWRISLTFRSFK